jgi:hypothetical protein
MNKLLGLIGSACVCMILLVGTTGCPQKDKDKAKPPVKPPGADNKGPGDKATDKKPGDLDKKPGDHDKKPGDLDKKPGDLDKKPGDLDKKPGDLDKKPTTDKKPADTDKKPGDTDKKPATDKKDKKDAYLLIPEFQNLYAVIQEELLAPASVLRRLEA